MARRRRRKSSRYKVTGKVGTGARTRRLTRSLSRKGVRNPKALAAHLGRKKFGKRKFAQLSAAGRRRAARKRRRR